MSSPLGSTETLLEADHQWAEQFTLSQRALGNVAIHGVVIEAHQTGPTLFMGLVLGNCDYETLLTELGLSQAKLSADAIVIPHPRAELATLTYDQLEDHPGLYVASSRKHALEQSAKLLEESTGRTIVLPPVPPIVSLRTAPGTPSIANVTRTTVL